MKRLENLTSYIACLTVIYIVIWMFSFGCAGSLRTYVSARTMLNNYWEEYLNYRDAMPEGPAKVELRAKFQDTGKTSLFTDAKDALDAWDKVVQSTDQTTQANAYYAIWEKLMAILLREGIIEIK